MAFMKNILWCQHTGVFLYRLTANPTIFSSCVKNQ